MALVARLCPFTHPYDIIWHWSSCHPSPPCLLPLPSSWKDHRKDGVSQTLSCFFAQRKQQLSVSQRAPAFSFQNVFSPITSTLSLYSSLSVFFPLFSAHRPPSLPVCCSPCVSHSLPQSIINFNLRAGLNGTIRERSMLSIWMPARLDLGIPHQRTRGEIAVFS